MHWKLFVPRGASDVDARQNPGEVPAVVDSATTATRTVECLSDVAGRNVDEAKQISERFVLIV